MQLTVEMYGLARRLSGEKEVSIGVRDGATLRDVVVTLTQRFPAFLGPLVDPETYELVKPYLLNYDGRRVAQTLEEQPQEGDRLLVLLVDAGG